MRKRDRCLAILNPTAAQGQCRREEVANACRALTDELDVVSTTRPGEAVELVADALEGPRPPHVVLAVGGDGTAAEAAEGMARGLGRWPAGSDHPGAVERHAPALLTLPAGSGNSAYRALWGDRAWMEALRTGFDGAPRCVRALDLIRLVECDAAAFLGVNVGLIARIAAHIERTKRASQQTPTSGDEGPDDLARYWAALGAVLESYSAAQVRITVDGAPLHEGGVMLATVGGVRRFGRGSFELLPRSLLDDALLDVCTVRAVSSERLGEIAALAPAGRHLGEREVAYAQGTRVAIEPLGGGPLEFEHDGDPQQTDGTLTLEVVAGAVPTLCAAASVIGQ